MTTVGEGRRYRQIALSPDERQVAFSLSAATTGRLELWTLDLTTGVTSRLTYAERSTDDPVWRPDGGALAYFSAMPEGVQVFEQTIGSRTASPMFAAAEEGRYPHDWSRDGRFLLFHRGNSLFVKPVGVDDPPRLLRQMQGSVDSGRFSPDGDWIAYGSNESGAWEMYVAPYPAFDRSRQDRRVRSGRAGAAVRVAAQSAGRHHRPVVRDTGRPALPVHPPAINGRIRCAHPGDCQLAAARALIPRRPRPGSQSSISN